jgi:pentatricopeptide repeat protein
MRNLASLISKCGKDANYRLVASLHAVAIKCANRRVLDEWNAIISMYSKCGLLDSAVMLFEEMPLRDSFGFPLERAFTGLLGETGTWDCIWIF